MSIIDDVYSAIEPYGRELGGLAVLLSLLIVFFINRGEPFPKPWFNTFPKLTARDLAVPRKVLDPVDWRGFTLVAKDHLSHNTAKSVSPVPAVEESRADPLS